MNNSIDRLVYSKDIDIKNMNGVEYENNFDFENRVSSKMSADIEELDKCIEFIVENRQENLTIKRQSEHEEIEEGYTIPNKIDYYLGKVEGKSNQNDNGNKAREAYGEDDHYSKEGRYLFWTEWIIQDSNDDYCDTMTIRISPYYVNFYTTTPVGKGGKGDYEESNISLRTSFFYDKWSSRLEDIFIENKKTQVPYIINSIYKNMGVDRKAKIEKLLNNGKK